MRKKIIKKALASASPKHLWRFEQYGPLNVTTTSPCRILFAGPHFQGGYEYFSQLLKEQSKESEIELILAPTPNSVLEVAPTVHVAIPFMEKFNSDFFTIANELRLCVQFGVGLEGVDIKAATQEGIAVSNIPARHSGNAQATSEHVLYLIMSLLRNNNQILERKFQNKILGGLPIPQTIYKKNITVVGYGNVGSVLTQYLCQMGANVTVVRRGKWENTMPTTPTRWEGIIQQHDNFIRSDSLEDTLPTTDILILACSMNSESLYLMNERTISFLPKHSIIVNVGRGPLVEYQSILTALKTNRIAGFASDVGVGGHPSLKPSEPWDPNDELSKLSNTVFTPHVGGYTDYSYSQMAQHIMTAVQEIIAGRPPPIWVNRDHQ